MLTCWTTERWCWSILGGNTGQTLAPVVGESLFFWLPRISWSHLGSRPGADLLTFFVVSSRFPEGRIERVAFLRSRVRCHQHHLLKTSLPMSLQPSDFIIPIAML